MNNDNLPPMHYPPFRCVMDKYPGPFQKEMKLIEEGIKKMNMSISDALNQYHKKRDLILGIALRDNAVPPIKGEITRGKLKWRGIYIVNTKFALRSWIEQRGKIISPIIELTYPFNIKNT